MQSAKDFKREPKMDISDRKRMILTAVIRLYTDSGDPVGSNILNHFLKTLSVSSATLRNEMAELTDLGLLMQPYTSAGRIPTQLGLRYYIDNLMNLYTPTTLERTSIFQTVASMDNDPEKASESSAKALAAMFGLSAVAMTPHSNTPHLVHFKLLRVGRFSLAVIGVSNAGSVKTRVCRIDQDISDKGIGTVEMVLNENLVFVSSEDITLHLEDLINIRLGILKKVAAPILSSAKDLIESLSDTRLYADGEQYLLHFRDMDGQIGSYLEFINDRQRMIRFLLETKGPLSICVGEEIDPSLPKMGMIVGTFRQGSLAGRLCVAGPSRINYAYIIPRFVYFCDSLSEMLTA